MGTAPQSPARQRVLDAALDLFSEHGVSGTSLQMIADRIGVTKAAVYHQFPAKTDIALGLLTDVFAALDDLVTRARARPVDERRDVMIAGIVETMVQQRQVMSALYRDPEMERVVAEHEDLKATRQRVDELLNPPGAGAEPGDAWAGRWSAPASPARCSTRSSPTSRTRICRPSWSASRTGSSAECRLVTSA